MANLTDYATIDAISKKVLINLKKHNVNITPQEYLREFCKLSNEKTITINDCKYFDFAKSKLTKDEKQHKDIETIYDVVDVLLQRIVPNNIDKISNIIQKGVTPSIGLQISDDLKSFTIKIGDSPSLIFEDSIQQEMERFIQERFEVDKAVVARKTADIAKLIGLIGKYLSDAIDSSKNGSINVSTIKDEIQSFSIETSSKEDLNELQDKLVQAAVTMEIEMDSVNKNLKAGQGEITALEDKIQQLEMDLEISKKESTSDHLTGLLTRRAYDAEIKKFEDNFTRDNENYALVFFDLDFFKKVNDDYGHDCGDLVLKTFAHILQKLTRKTDILGRFGGEEFIAAIKYKDEEELVKYLTRVKQLVTTNKFKYKDIRLNVTFSAGVELRSAHNNYSDTIKKADELLYKAKETGRNKIVLGSGTEIL